jgi:ATP-dependent exoDNAse (exonuclease V) beta subunit
VYELVSVFDLLNHFSGQEYLWKFLDILNDYVVLKDKSVVNFLQHFNQNRNSYCISSSSTENAVTISSIHKSKGLEYPVVILPFINWTYAPDSEKIWFDLSELDIPELEMENSNTLNFVHGRVNSFEPATISELTGQIQAEKDAILLDSLNMLYVATTRPKQALHLILSVPNEDMHNRTIATFENSVGKLLHEFAEKQGTKMDLPDFLQTETSWSSAYYTFDNVSYVPKIQHDDKLIQNKKVQVRLQNIPSSIHLRVNTSQSDLYTAASKKREIGNQLHDLLAQLPDIDAWPSLRAKSKVDTSKLDDLLSLEKIQVFFKKDLLAFKEVDLLCPDGSIVRPDRVNKVGDDLQVIDFKTGKPKPEHHTQINKYKQTLISMGHSVCKGVLIYVDSKDLEYV